MFSKRKLVVALCVWLAVVQGCRHESSPEITLAHEVFPQPPRVGRVTITLKITDASAKPVAGARIRLEGNMSHAGMAPISVDAKEIAPGSYHSIMELSMAGDWYVLVHATLRNGSKLERQFEIKGVAPADR